MNREEREKFIEIIDRLKDLRIKKSMDYGYSWKVWGLEGIVWQLKSKFIRMTNLLNTQKVPANESLTDTFKDIANYAIMAIQLIESGETANTIDELLTIKEIDK
jgi:hypothetical protein